MLYPLSDYLKTATSREDLDVANKRLKKLTDKLARIRTRKERMERTPGLKITALQKLTAQYTKLVGGLDGRTVKDIEKEMWDIADSLRNLSEGLGVRELRQVSFEVSNQLHDLREKQREPIPEEDRDDEYYAENAVYAALRAVRAFLEEPIEKIVKPLLVDAVDVGKAIAPIQNLIDNTESDIEKAKAEVSRITNEIGRQHEDETRVHNTKVNEALRDARSKNEFFDHDYLDQNPSALEFTNLKGKEVGVKFFPGEIWIYYEARFAINLRSSGGATEIVYGYGKELVWRNEDITYVEDLLITVRFVAAGEKYSTQLDGPGEGTKKFAEEIVVRYDKHQKEVREGTLIRMAKIKLEELATKLRRMGMRKITISSSATRSQASLSFTHRGKQHLAAIVVRKERGHHYYTLEASVGSKRKQKRAVELDSAVDWFLKKFTVSETEEQAPKAVPSPDDVKTEADGLRRKFRVSKKNAIIAAILITVISTSTLGTIVFRRNIARFFRRSSALFQLALNGLKEQGWVPGKALTPAQKFYLIKLVEGLDPEEARELAKEYKRMMPRYGK